MQRNIFWIQIFLPERKGSAVPIWHVWLHSYDIYDSVVSFENQKIFHKIHVEWMVLVTVNSNESNYFQIIIQKDPGQIENVLKFLIL